MSRHFRQFHDNNGEGGIGIRHAHARRHGRLDREISFVNSIRWTDPVELLSFLRGRGWRTVPGEMVFWCGPITLFRGNTFALLSSRIDQDGQLTWILAKWRPETDNIEKAVSNLNQYHRWWSEPDSMCAKTFYSRNDEWRENHPHPPFWPHMNLIDRYLRRHGWTMETSCVSPTWTKRGWKIRFTRHPENPFRGQFEIA